MRLSAFILNSSIRERNPHRFATGDVAEDSCFTSVQRCELGIFGISVTARLLVLVILNCGLWELSSLSPDSAKYHRQGLQLAEQYAQDENHWSHWVDDGWRQFVGLVYSLVGPHVTVVQAFNIVLAALTAVLVFRPAMLSTQNVAAARLAGYGFALFPSMVFYTALPLKEAAAALGLVALCYGTVQIVTRNHRGWIWIAVGFGITAALRLYLVLPCICGIAVCLLFGFMDWRGLPRWRSLLLSSGAVGAAILGPYFAGFEFKRYSATRYFDLQEVNKVRVSLADGYARMFDDQMAARFGASPGNDVRNVAKGVYAFLFGIEIGKSKRPRHLAVIPESLFVLASLPFMIIGVVAAWKRHARKMLPVVAFGLMVMIVYVAAATNAGAMLRWRMQAMPFFLVLAAQGSVVVFLKRKNGGKVREAVSDFEDLAEEQMAGDTCQVT